MAEIKGMTRKFGGKVYHYSTSFKNKSDTEFAASHYYGKPAYRIIKDSKGRYNVFLHKN